MSVRRRRRFDGLSWAAVATIVLAAAAVVWLDRARDARLAARLVDDRRAVQRYAETINPLAFEGGRVIEERVKPRLAALADGKVTGEDFRTEAAAWSHDLEEVRKAFAAASPPARLVEAAALFDQAMRAYLNAVRAFSEASHRGGTPEQIDAALEPGRDIARGADKTYDRARRMVQDELRRVGLPESLFS